MLPKLPPVKKNQKCLFQISSAVGYKYGTITNIGDAYGNISVQDEITNETKQWERSMITANEFGITSFYIRMVEDAAHYSDQKLKAYYSFFSHILKKNIVKIHEKYGRRNIIFEI